MRICTPGFCCSRENSNSNTHLTRRQRDVLQLLAEERTAKEIATTLNISSWTVELHKVQILTQLNLQTTADLIKYALTHGIVQVT